MTFGTSVFLSYPQPHMARQEKFVTALSSYLGDRGLTARTLAGVTDYSGVSAVATASASLSTMARGGLAQPTPCYSGAPHGRPYWFRLLEACPDA